MFECPKCHTPVPKSKAILLNKSSVIYCQRCHISLRPKEDVIRRIGAIGAGSTAVMAYIALNLMGIPGAFLVLVIGIVIVTVITINNVEFEIMDSQ
jgi:hypothetical protein